MNWFVWLAGWALAGWWLGLLESLGFWGVATVLAAAAFVWLVHWLFSFVEKELDGY